MVGSLQNPNSKEQEENFLNPSLSVVGCLEDLSFSYADSFLDFDYIKDWIEENPEPYKSMASDLGGNPVGFNSENISWEMFDRSPKMGSAEIGDRIEGEEGLVSDEGGKKLGSLHQENVELVGGEKGSEIEDFSEKIKVDEGVKMGGLKCLIEEEMGKVNLDGRSDALFSVGGGVSGIQDGGNENGEKIGGCDAKCDEAADVVDCRMESGVVMGIGTEIGISGISGEKSGNKGNDGDESDSNSDSESKNDSDDDSESESESSSSSASSSSSDDDDTDDDDEEEKGGKTAKGGNAGIERKREETDMEEGEIVASDPEQMVVWSGDEYDEDDSSSGVATMGPPKSKNEITALPPVPPVNVTLQPHHEILPIGVVLSVLGAQVIVEGVEKHNPLSEGSILWITDSRSPLGLVDEIFGPVRNPYYIVRYNSESEIPEGIQPGSSISFVPEFANHVLNDKSLYMKGYDASGANDEELLEEEEFSDDEKEAEYRKMLKDKKRATSDHKVGNKKKDEKRFGNWSRSLKCDSTINRHLPIERAELQFVHNGCHVPPIDSPMHQGNQLHSSGLQQGLTFQPGLAPPFAQLTPNFGVNAMGVPMDLSNKSCSSGLGQSLAYQPGLAPPFSQLGLSSGFGASSGVGNANPFQQPQGFGLPQLSINGMHWVQQINQLYQMPLQNRLPTQLQINGTSDLPSNLVLSGRQSGFGAEPALAPWPASSGQNTFINSPFGIGTPGQQVSLSANVGEQAAPSNISETRHNDSLQQHTSFSGELNTSQKSSHVGGRKPHRRGGGRFRGGRRGRQQRG